MRILWDSGDAITMLNWVWQRLALRGTENLLTLLTLEMDLVHDRGGYIRFCKH
jgi:hypothetical protein